LTHNPAEAEKDQVLTEALIDGWLRALAVRDDETYPHTQRTSALAVALARALGITETQVRYVRWGALLHDIGKIGIPDQVLFKPGALSDPEWEIMRRHPVYAHEWLTAFTFLKPALDIPYCHHERWDGRGYPRGLSGQAIPWLARLFAVVDVWDALSSDRPYRASWPETAVWDYIQANSGAHFDPQVVAAFYPLIRSLPFQYRSGCWD
jgi:putative nucleotidyltransferase with HDIG domain